MSPPKALVLGGFWGHQHLAEVFTCVSDPVPAGCDSWLGSCQPHTAGTGSAEPQAGGSTPTVLGSVGSILWFGRHPSVCLPCSGPSCGWISSYTSPSVDSGGAVISSSHWALSVEVDFNAH